MYLCTHRPHMKHFLLVRAVHIKEMSWMHYCNTKIVINPKYFVFHVHAVQILESQLDAQRTDKSNTDL